MLKQKNRVAAVLISGLFMACLAAARPAPPDMNQVETEMKDIALARGIVEPEVVVLWVDGAIAAVAVSGQEPSRLERRSAKGATEIVGILAIAPSGESFRGEGAEVSVLRSKFEGSMMRLEVENPTLAEPIHREFAVDAAASGAYLREGRCRFFCKLGKKILDAAVDILIEWAKQKYLREAAGANADWTEWLNRDNAGGSGDYETLSEFLKTGQACANPIAIECSTLDGRDWAETGQNYVCDVGKGGICVNRNQSGSGCLDYRVRFLCPR